MEADDDGVARACARLTSDSVMPPTPAEITSTLTCSVASAGSDDLSASAEPCTSALRTTLSSLTAPSLMRSRMFSSDTLVLPASSFLRRESRRCSTSSLACFSSPTVLKVSPASGTPERPSTSTGVDGPTSVSVRPLSSSMARTLPMCSPATTVSPSFKVPSCTSTVAIGPRLRSSLASMTVPRAALFGLALSSSSSDCSEIICSS